MHTWNLKLTFLSSSIQFKNIRTLYPNHPYHCTFYCFPVFYSTLTLNPGWMLLWLFSIAPIYGDLNLLISLLTIPLCIAAFLSALFPSFLEYTPLVNDSKKQIVLVLIFWKVLSYKLLRVEEKVEEGVKEMWLFEDGGRWPWVK